MEAVDQPKASPFGWFWELLAALNLTFLLPFIQNQFRTLPYPTTPFTGQTIIVTGATGGLGLEAARHFARLGAARVILACRNVDSGQQAKARIESTGVVEVWPLDLTSFASVREFARRAERELDRLDVVVENAGVLRSRPQAVLAAGYEVTVTVNVLSTFLLALMLLPVLKRTAGRFNTQPRLVIVSSDAHMLAKFKERSAPSIFGAFNSAHMPADRYQTSKLLEVLVVRQLAYEMQRHQPQLQHSPVILNTVNPGFCRTDLFRENDWLAAMVMGVTSRLLGRSAEEGARVLVWAAAAGPETHGEWIDSCRVREPSAFVRSPEGERVQERVYRELMDVLEEVEPGVTKNV